MPHGTPDWGHLGPKGTVFGLDDLAEHAVRLGSPHLWDRRGDVVWWTIFDEGTSPVTLDLGGAAGPIRLDTGESRQGAYSLKLTIQDDEADEARIHKDLPATRYSGLGLECHFTTHGAEGIWELDITVARWTDTWRGRVRWDPIAGTLVYWDGVTPWVEFEDGRKATKDAVLWHVMKLVLDLDAQRYNRLILDLDDFDMGAYPLPGLVTPSETLWTSYIRYVGNGDSDVTDWVDSIIITQNEP